MNKFIVFTALANASALISGVAFPHEVDGGRATDPVEPGVAAKFKGIAGYEIRDAAPAAPALAETPPVVRESAAAKKARLAEEARAAAARDAAPPAEPEVEPEVEAGAGADAEPGADANAPDADAPDADAPAADAPDADAPAAESSGDQ